MTRTFSASTLDDLMYELLGELINLPFNVVTSRGNTSEIVGTLFHLSNPLARLSRTETKGLPFSALGELLWYLSGSNAADFISYYIHRYEDDAEEDGTIYGGYGPRLFKMRGKYNQIETIIQLLDKNPNTRRAVIQLFDVEDIIERRKEVPCTCTLQFFVREGRLHMFTSMRSNDAFLGFPHDIFSFTMIQEIIATRLGLEIGHYTHAVGSTHLYEEHVEKTRFYLDEGIQGTTSPMPHMPKADLQKSIAILIEAEKAIRLSSDFTLLNYDLEPYWLDLIRMLQIQGLYLKVTNDTLKDTISTIITLKGYMNNHSYNIYIDKKIAVLQNKLLRLHNDA